MGKTEKGYSLYCVALVLLADHLKLTVHSQDPLIFIDPDGKKWIKTEHGFSPSMLASAVQELKELEFTLFITENKLQAKEKRIEFLERELERHKVHLDNADEDVKLLTKWLQATKEEPLVNSNGNKKVKLKPPPNHFIDALSPKEREQLLLLKKRLEESSV